MANQGSPEKESRAPRWLFDHIAEASKNARSIYFLYLATVAYCALTVLTTRDEKIFFNEPVRLPIVNLEVQFNTFFGLAPFLIIFLFIYFQLYLGKLKSLVDELVSTYGNEEKRRIYPWMINFGDEESEFSADGSWLQKPISKTVRYFRLFIVDFSLWLLLPSVLSLIGWKYLYKQDPVYSYWMAMVPVVGGVLTWLFWEYYEPVRASANRLRFVAKLTPVVFSVVVATWLFIKIEPTLNGEYFEIDLQDRRFSKNLSLREARLAGANMERAILDSIDLRQANLRNATLREATMVGANLSGADLRGANLDSAKLQNARIVNADLSMASLRGANLQGADLSNATLLRGDLRGANLSQTRFGRANLRGVRLEGATLGISNLDSTDMQGAIVDSGELDERCRRTAIWLAADGGQGYFRAFSDTSLSLDSARAIVENRGFFDIRWNANASGFTNDFELHFGD